MALRYADERAAIVRAGQEIAARQLSHGTTGNLSLRVAEGALVKPSGVPYASMRAEDVPLVALDDARVLESPNGAKPTSELAMHVAILRARADVHAIAHAHPPNATALAAAGRGIPAALDEVVMFLGGAVQVSTYAPSGTEDLARHVTHALGDRAAALIANHGAVGVGRDLREAVEALALCEEAARVTILATAAGGLVRLPEAAVERWRAFYLSGARRY